MVFQSTSKFHPGLRLVFESLLFITDKMGYLSLQELESWEITGSGTDRVHPIPSRDGLACEALLRHESSISGESEPDPARDNANHQEIYCPAATDPIYKTSPESDSDSGRHVFMVGPGEHSADQSVEQITREAEAEVAWVARLAHEANKVAGKRHRGRQDNSGVSEDEAEDGAASGGHHPKYNRYHPTGQDRLQNFSQMLHEEISRIEW
jgi:hypothetical protein